MVEDDLWWKTTFGGVATSKQGRKLRFGMLTVLIIYDQSRCYGRLKTTFGGRQPSVEDTLWWKTTFGGRQHLVEDDLQWKTTFSGR